MNNLFAFLNRLFKKKTVMHGTGAVKDQIDPRDYRYEPIAAGSVPVDWNKGYDIEKELNIKIPIKDQSQSSSCVGQGWAYYGAVLNTVETGVYDEQSAKALYSQISLGPNRGAYIRDGATLFTDWGSIEEHRVPSYDDGKPPTEQFMLDKRWKTPMMDKIADMFKAKDYRTFLAAQHMDMFAQAIRDNYGVVGGVEGTNNGTWKSFEPQPPGPNRADWAHCLYFGKFGIDEKGKYISTPNSWGNIGTDRLHPDGWQKFRESWFKSIWMFNPWTLVDRENIVGVSPEATKILINYDKKFVIEGEGPGRKGIIVGGQLRPVRQEREASASIYVQANSGQGVTVSTKLFDELPRGANF